ncbi:hypothetical protein LCGC14_1173040 [marine sediment metagenome]|uniref:Uncharacterized protein n=1 Tax=marine sediment metagenome TaxID=412755 RepID=A0A0F9PUS7_9ZZZZ|nr:hypothetical protein [bacterium]
MIEILIKEVFIDNVGNNFDIYYKGREEAIELSRELVQHHERKRDPGLLAMFAYTVKGRKHKNKILFVANFLDGDAYNRIVMYAQGIEARSKLGQMLETIEILRCSSIE